MRRTMLSTALLLTSIFLQAQNPTPRPGKFVNVFGARMHYVEAGSGPTLVLVHGLADDTTIWEHNIDALAKNFRVVAVDQIGFGKSDKPSLSYRVATFSDFLGEFLAQLKIEKATLVGNSLGGWVAARCAIDHPERIAGIVLVNSAGFADVEEVAARQGFSLEWLEFSSLELNRKSLPFLFYSRKMYEGAAGEEFARALLTQRIANQDGYTINRFLESMRRDEDTLDGSLNRIRVPALVIWGEKDAMIPLQMGERFQREISGARLIRIPDCGHMPQYECPEAFNAAVIGNLRPPR